MERWTPEEARLYIHNFEALSAAQQIALLSLLDRRYPPSVFYEQRKRLERALAHARKRKAMLERATVEYPPAVEAVTSSSSGEAIRRCAVVLTAGGEGERLRASLLGRGGPKKQLCNFTKATFPIPGLRCGYGPLQVNLCALRRLALAAGYEPPVVVTVGPPGSSTATIIPRLLAAEDNLNLSNLRIIEQDERLHLTAEGKIAYRIKQGVALPVTNPDETGGPLMKLRAVDPVSGCSVLDTLQQQGCTTIVVLQATAVYDPSLIVALAAAARCFDAVGVGIPRDDFVADDPFGSFVMVCFDRERRLEIVEPGWRLETMRTIRDPTGRWFLPYNTGFYAFDAKLLRNHSLPDYCTPPKEVLPGLPRAPKTGYAATDMFPLATHPAVLIAVADSFAVLKSVDDLPRMADVCRRHYPELT